jgi:DNA-binding MarR family transcriptional regulator
MEFQKNTSAGFLINILARSFAKQLHAQIAPLGIVPGQFPILLELWEKEGQTQRDMLVKLQIEQATLANTLNRMERDGLIKRTKHLSDGRAQQVWLTNKTRNIKTEALSAASRINTAAMVDLSDDEKQQLINLMQTVVARISD